VPTTLHDLAISAVVGITSGFFAAWLAIWQGRIQRSWEKKEDAYIELLDALHTLNSNNTEWLDAYYSQRDLPTERQDQLRGDWSLAKYKILRHAELGAVLTSPAVAGTLTILVTALAKRHDDYFLHLDADSASLRKALTEVKNAALDDRRAVPFSWLHRPKWPTW
jgi:hypothetical protein